MTHLFKNITTTLFLSSPPLSSPSSPLSQAAYDTNYWNPVIHIFIWGSILTWLIVPPFLSNILTLYEVSAATYFGVSNEVLASSMFWLYLIVATVIAVLPGIAVRVITNEIWPTLLEDVKLCESNKRHSELIDNLKSKLSKEEATVGVAEEKGDVPILWRSGYAFSHQEGFGGIISTGKYLGASANEIEQQRTLRRNTWMKGDTPIKRKKPSLLESGLAKGLEAGLSIAMVTDVVGVVDHAHAILMFVINSRLQLKWTLPFQKTPHPLLRRRPRPLQMWTHLLLRRRPRPLQMWTHPRSPHQLLRWTHPLLQKRPHPLYRRKRPLRDTSCEYDCLRTLIMSITILFYPFNRRLV